MGRIFRAEQRATGRLVAVKLLHSEFAGVEEVALRFEREAKVMSQLTHPNIVKVIEFGEWKGRLFFAMELVGGKSLADLLKYDARNGGRRLSLKRTLAIMCEGYSHTRGRPRTIARARPNRPSAWIWRAVEVVRGVDRALDALLSSVEHLPAGVQPDTVGLDLVLLVQMCR